MYLIPNKMNFRKNDVRSVSLVLLAFSMIMGTALTSDAYAQGSGMSMDVTSEGSTLSVSGQTTTLLNDVTIRVTAPSGKVVDVAQVSPGLDGEYMKDIQIGSHWNENGWYTIRAQQGDSTLYQLTMQVEISGGSVMDVSESQSSLDFGTGSIVTPTDDVGGLTMTVDAPEGALAIGIDGQTDHTHTDVTLTVYAPNGNLISVDQITPNQNGAFSTVIGVGCPSWEQDGFYTITAKQGVNNFYSETAEVEIKDCVVVPEFGTIAAMILAIAIVSIIAVTARSKLSVMPRF